MGDIYSSRADLIKELKAYTHIQLIDWLSDSLTEGTENSQPLPTNLEPHVFLSSLFRKCNQPLQNKLRKAFASILESFEPPTNPQGNDLRYLFYLLSLAAVVRSDQAKDRLRRWLYNNAFEGWKYEIFDLRSELVIATATYDPDNKWLAYILRTLPKSRDFQNISLAAYRAILQTKGLESLSLLPKILYTANFEDKGFIKSFGYLLRLTIDRSNIEMFADKLIAVFDNTESSISEACTAIIRFTLIKERELWRYEKELDDVLNHLHKLWNDNITEWRSTPIDISLDYFDEIFQACGKQSTIIPRPFFSHEVIGILAYCGRYEIAIMNNDKHLINYYGPFFELVYQEKAAYASA